MAIYFVDGEFGSDTNNGNSKETAWKTINKAAQTITAGNIAYVRPGVYREIVTFANSGSEGNYIELIGDENGEIWGEKGIVAITNLNSDSDTYAARTCILNINYKNYIKIKNFLLYGTNKSNAPAWLIQYLGNYLEFENCIIQYTERGSPYYVTACMTDENKTNHTFKRCIFITDYQKSNINALSSAYCYNYTSAVTNLALTFENCIFLGQYKPILLNYASGTITIKNCIFNNHYYCIKANNGAFNTTYILNLYNNFFKDINTFISALSSTIIESGNYYQAIASFGNVSSFGTEQFTLLNLSDFLLLDKNLFFLKDKVSSNYPNVDIRNNPRPLQDNADAGAFEFNPPAQKETTIKRTGNASLKLIKASFQDIKTFLTSGSHTISVYTRWSGYSGTNKPQLIIKQDKFCGINSDTIATATGDGTDWEQISVNITLSCDAEITIRLYSRDTGTNALTYFDDLEIT